MSPEAVAFRLDEVRLGLEEISVVDGVEVLLGLVREQQRERAE